MPRRQQDNLPGTLKRSPPKAQRTYAKVLESAEKEYGPGERASRTAIAALKHSFEKVGDHWEAKARPGPSDPRARQSTADKRGGKGETFGGVDILGHTRQELYERAKELDIRGRSSMSKEELARAISKKQD
ncbi:ChaB family protein [Aromatoleum sp.]|uniref:ChaB family protein n=1 Tax=Aromatoleum sp. TaxID=2307007 RepID=UPI002FCA7835